MSIFEDSEIFTFEENDFDYTCSNKKSKVFPN